MARFYHRLVGWSAVALSAAHLVAVSIRGRYLFPLWLIGLLVLLPGLWMAFTAARLGGAAVAAATLLLLSASAELALSGAGFPALFAAAALVDLVVLAAATRRHARIAAIACVLLGATVLYAAAASVAAVRT